VIRPATESRITLGGPGIDPALLEKRERLASILGAMGRTLVAYSGGVDSAFLLAETHRVLGAGALGVIARSASLPEAELSQALEVAAARGIPVRIVETREMDLEAYRANGPDRCYHCKAELFLVLGRIASEESWDSLAYGALMDDLGDVRPGMAAADRHRVRAPLIEAGLGKLEVRRLARDIGLRVWDKPQSACLASRIPHGSRVTEEKLQMIERGEAWLRGAFGLKVVRLRHEGSRARIEVLSGEIPRLLADRAISLIKDRLGGLGFGEVLIDPEGYRRSDPQPEPEGGLPV
jgi:pyridinium-3,5-biscarboxylic acid mononucleotide sulfurtransferase